jgi:hypothetical protein
MKETDRIVKETAQQMKETDRQMKETDRKTVTQSDSHPPAVSVIMEFCKFFL